ncbi:MAG TPA: DUF2255 family protein [Acetobacteraceae bacterium]|jgi:hypothetical protein|nr:DUF2255 family protein [Acetobacteraceae bacterium]
MPKFDADTLSVLRDTKEVAIRTGKHPTQPVTIWVVVVGEEVFVRSVRGSRGRWYKDLAAGGPATLDIGDRQLPVQAIPAPDAASVDHASREYLAKYRTSPYAEPMVRAEVLPTTLRLEAR